MPLLLQELVDLPSVKDFNFIITLILLYWLMPLLTKIKSLRISFILKMVRDNVN